MGAGREPAGCADPSESGPAAWHGSEHADGHHAGNGRSGAKARTGDPGGKTRRTKKRKAPPALHRRPLRDPEAQLHPGLGGGAVSVYDPGGLRGEESVAAVRGGGARQCHRAAEPALRLEVLRLEPDSDLRDPVGSAFDPVPVFADREPCQCLAHPAHGTSGAGGDFAVVQDVPSREGG